MCHAQGRSAGAALQPSVIFGPYNMTRDREEFAEIGLAGPGSGLAFAAPPRHPVGVRGARGRVASTPGPLGHDPLGLHVLQLGMGAASVPGQKSPNVRS